MANSLLSPTIITREALRILHANLNFISNCDKQYDDQFANSGASPSGKIGPSLTIRMPNQFTVRTGAALSTQDVVETSQVLTVSAQKGVDFVFSSQDLTLTIDQFSDRYLKPAMSVLATNIEADALSMILDVYNAVDDNGSPLTYLDIANGRKLLNQYLAPSDGRAGIMTSGHVVSFLDAIKGFFNPQESVAKPYLTGKIGKVNGIDTYENTVLAPFQSGTAAATTGYAVNGASQTGSSVTVGTGTATLLKGDIVTFAGCFAVDPETKSNRGFLQQFVLTANSGASATSLAISPAIVVTGAAQNVSASPTTTGAVLKVGGGASALYSQSMLFHPEAFAFVTADLVDVSKFGAWGARQVMDGISMRIARQYNISNDTVPCRMDVLYGFKTLRPQLACRVIAL
ncbi:MAG: P22 phage major capsid protein family protein [Ktedonobacteraceae bacterium]